MTDLFTLPSQVAGLLSWPRASRIAVEESSYSVCAFMALAATAERRVVMVVAPSAHHLDSFASDAQAFHDEGQCEMLLFPMLDSGNGEDHDALGRRLETARRLYAGGEKPILVATCVQALMQTVPDPKRLEARTLELLPGSVQALDDLVEACLKGGYKRVTEVSDKRQFAVKGGIVDIWPLTERYPLRLELWDERVESIRQFDPGDQRTIARPESMRLPPASNRGATSLLADMLPADAVLCWLDLGMVEEFARQFEENAAIPTQRSLDAMRGKLDASDRLRQIDFGLVVPEGWARMELPLAPCAAAPAGDIRDPDRLAAHRLGLLAELEERIVKENLNVYICLDTEGIREHLIAEIGDRGMRIIVQPLSEGFEITALNTVVLSQSDLYGRYKRHAVRRPTARETAASAGERLTSLDHISAGDLVVHVEHGIGRYVGVTELEFDGRRSEMLTIEYAGNSKLHVPIGQAHLLSRYIGTGESVRLHALGGRRWSAEKDAAEKSVADMAAAMLETQARRAHLPGHAYAAETPWLHEFEASFPYTETDDQANCVTDVKRDMYSTHPMDRLICGDAGYGKTEVAMRAAFIAAMQGRQVAVLVPTTVLAQQHYDTFRERMAPYPIMIGVHSRFCTVTQRARVLQQVADGKLDIVIGTHGLLRPSVKFKDLGLVIIDEEQRFGVGHKEHFKRMRALVDVLTLSATPIPRTLQMGLTGVRDLSLLQTPPQERVATETRVVSDGDEVVRLAIERELDRGGQVFYLYNRVLTIDRMRERITRLVPRASIGVGHGQMPAKQIEDTMLRFTRGELDILLCTTIIESGVDIPRANTILIDRADRFGIADLYQLRGRVGRAARKGYALLLVPDSGVLDADARERLKALRQHSGTGAAFQLALRDLGIRGAGNLLGAAQSGHIAAVGFMLYCQLLRRSVAQLRGEKPPLLVNVSLRMDLLDFAPGQMDAGGAVCLPYGYVDDESQRISLYRRLAECASQVEVDAIGQELADRFGRPPQAALRLLTVTGLRIRAAAAGIQRIEVREGEVSLFRDGVPVRIKGKLPVITTRSADAQLAALRRMLGQR